MTNESHVTIEPGYCANGNSINKKKIECTKKRPNRKLQNETELGFLLYCSF